MSSPVEESEYLKTVLTSPERVDSDDRTDRHALFHAPDERIPRVFPATNCDDCESMLNECIGSDCLIERDLQIDRLESSSDACQFCDFLLSLLRGPDGVLLLQAKAYGDDAFNPVGLYDENGISDHEAMDIITRRRNRVDVELSLSYDSSWWGYPTRFYGQLEVRMQLRLWTQRIRKHDAEHSRTVLKRLPLVSTSSDGSASPYALLRHGPDPRPAGTEKFVKIANWLKSCARIPPVVIAAHPSRLLDISDLSRIKIIDYQSLLGPDGLSRPSSPHMYSTSNLVNYVALSHRWGPSRHLTATLNNYHRLRDGIDLSMLPHTFRDATLFARQLGIHHLWIDALCILQDSPEDWLCESQKMGDIFTNAEVTFAIHCAENDAGGFLQKALSKSPILEYRSNGRTKGLCLPSQPECDVTNSDLSKRGWVLQERFLSQRSIHFTSGRVYLESDVGILCENGMLVQETPRKSGDITARRLYSPYALPDLRSRLGLDTQDSEPSEYTRTTLEWLHVVEMYSRCDLTKDTDKLVAIAGMARKMQRSTQQSWCAGIWADYICQGLLWCPTTSGILAPRHRRAPSWSWASWDGAIQYPTNVWDFGFHSRCSFVRLYSGERLNAGSWLDGPGQLVLRGLKIPLAPFYINMDRFILGPGPRRKGKQFDIPHATWKSYSFAAALRDSDIFDSYSSTHGWAVLDQFHTDDSEAPIVEFENASRPAPFAPAVHFLILGTHFSILGTQFSRDDRLLCLGIFLVPSDQFGDGKYKRLGVGHVEWESVCERICGTEFDKSSYWWANDLARDPVAVDSLFSEDKLTEITIE